MVADFYEVPRDRLGELPDAAKGGWGRIGSDRERVNAVLSSFRRPVARCESPRYYLAAVLGVIGDTPLPDGEEMLGDGSPVYEDILMELVESRCGDWEIIEPSAARVAALDPRAFDAERLRGHYAGELNYYPAEDEEDDDEPGLSARYSTGCALAGLRTIPPMRANRCRTTSRSSAPPSPASARAASF